MFTEEFYRPFGTLGAVRLRGGFRLHINRPSLKQPELGTPKEPLAEGKVQFLLEELLLQVPFEGGIRFHQSAQLPFNLESTSVADARFPMKGNYLLLFLCLCIFTSPFTFRCSSGLQGHMLLLCFSLIFYNMLNTAAVATQY